MSHGLVSLSDRVQPLILVISEGKSHKYCHLRLGHIYFEYCRNGLMLQRQFLLVEKKTTTLSLNLYYHPLPHPVFLESQLSVALQLLDLRDVSCLSGSCLLHLEYHLQELREWYAKSLSRAQLAHGKTKQ